MPKGKFEPTSSTPAPEFEIRGNARLVFKVIMIVRMLLPWPRNGLKKLQTRVVSPTSARVESLVSRLFSSSTGKAKSTRHVAGFSFPAFLLVFLAWPAQAVELDTLLANMDRASDAYRGMQAQVSWIKYTDIVEDTSTEEGVIKVLKDEKGQVNLLIEFEKPYPYFVSIQGTKVEIYRPRIATVEEYDVSKSKDALEQALMLGFGTAGRFLSEHYELKIAGEEEAAGEATVKLELVPNTEKMRQSMSGLEMWISKSQWQPVQQKLYGPNPGDYRLYTYTDISLNPPLKDSALRLKIPRKVKRVFPQR